MCVQGTHTLEPSQDRSMGRAWWGSALLQGSGFHCLARSCFVRERLAKNDRCVEAFGGQHCKQLRSSFATMADREDSVYIAKLAEQAERYDEMVEEMKKVARMVHDQELGVEERNLLSVAYKNVIGARRASWRIISSIEQKEESKGNEEHVNRIKKYRQVVSGQRVL